MKRRKPETLGVFYEHNGGVRNVYADFNNSCADEQLYLARSKAAHDFVLFRALHFTVQQSHAVVFESAGGYIGEILLGALDSRRLLAFLYHGTDDIPLPALVKIFFYVIIHALAKFTCYHVTVGLCAATRVFIENADIKIAVNYKSESARYRRCRHNERMDVLAFKGERRALINAEAVLFVSNDESDVAKLNILRQKRVRTDGYLRFAAEQPLLCCRFFAFFHRAGE